MRKEKIKLKAEKVGLTLTEFVLKIALNTEGQITIKSRV